MTRTETRRVAKVIVNLKQRGPIVAADQGSGRGHQCTQTSLIGNPSSRSVGAPPGHKALLPPRAGSEQLTHWTSETM